MPETDRVLLSNHSVGMRVLRSMLYMGASMIIQKGRCNRASVAVPSDCHSIHSKNRKFLVDEEYKLYLSNNLNEIRNRIDEMINPVYIHYI